MPAQGAKGLDEQLTEDMGRFTHDPLGYVMYSFPWGEGELLGKAPRQWQIEYLTELGRECVAAYSTGGAAAVTQVVATAIRRAVASGHGIGKSALVAWLTLWGLSTCEDTRVIITANTEPQLKSKTWPELAKWHRLAINKHWFVFTATSLYSADPEHEKTWRADMLPWSEARPESFAGLHNEGKRIIVIFDEASAISDVIWETTEGAMTDSNTEIFWFVFGNPTRKSGRFFTCFNRGRHRWANIHIDSREVEGTNKIEIAGWVEDYGEDSDFVRIRVRGLFPSASSMQFIDSDVVSTAMRKEAFYLKDDPLIMALDIARGGDDECVFRFRRGFDGRSIPPVKIPGSKVKDSMLLVSKAVELIGVHKPDAFMFDGTGVGGPVGDRLRQLGHPMFEVGFGTASPDPKQANMRAYIWQKMKDWLMAGGAIDKDTKLETDLTNVEYSHNKRDQVILEPKDVMKRRGLASPDDADALAMTFAFAVAPKGGAGSGGGSSKGRKGEVETAWEPEGGH